MPTAARRAPISSRYHHGDLRAALIRAATDLIAEGDLSRLSLRQVSERAGVSRSAPYHHFTHKNDLLAAVASQAFDDLREALDAAIASRRSPVRRVEAAAHAYVDFALANPACFRVMSMPELAYVETPRGKAKLESAARSFSLLVELVAAVRPAGTSDEVLRALAVTVYATLHGFARLCIDGSFAQGPNERRVLQRAVIANVLAMVEDG